MCFELQAEAESVDKAIIDLSVQDKLNVLDKIKVEAFVGEFVSLSEKHDEIPVDDFNNDDVYKKSLEEVRFLLKSSNSCVESSFLAGANVQKEHFI